MKINGRHITIVTIAVIFFSIFMVCNRPSAKQAKMEEVEKQMRELDSIETIADSLGTLFAEDNHKYAEGFYEYWEDEELSVARDFHTAVCVTYNKLMLKIKKGASKEVKGRAKEIQTNKVSPILDRIDEINDYWYEYRENKRLAEKYGNRRQPKVVGTAVTYGANGASVTVIYK